MFDDLLDIATGYNLITPLASFFQDIIKGPYCYFGIPSMAGWSKREIGRTLARHGVDRHVDRRRRMAGARHCD